MKKAILCLLAAVMLAGCDPHTFLGAPEDWVYHPHPQDSTTQDTLPTDTIVVDTIIPPPPPPPPPECEDSLYLEPAFVTGWWYIPDLILSDLQVCVWPHCVTVPAGTDITNILDSLLNVFDPTYNYRVYVSDTDFRNVAFFAEGTNDHEYFHGTVWFRPVTSHSGWGFSCIPQGYLFASALSFEEAMVLADELPSANYISFKLQRWTAAQNVKFALKCLECRKGRNIIDFRLIFLDTGEPFTMPDSIIQMAIMKDWTEVRY